ncbi:hypothetical protein P775_08380 [Puniceibacterium antarcticum]|uniref:N-acetyltransferase domain-containing protein n=1 Tax=Puniceibacterium antarcticum TaxID=1206336 RepID=A0A2G8RG12_9RHOB|nr:hypothetical protein [Puniceibacterium antarcticum]PIL20536.1 hypothetical protein P775_08380 [Puniceibacterium antarcticum]
MIQAGPYEDHAALEVFRRLDASDLQEAALARGAEGSHLALWAEWRGMQAVGVLSHVLRTRSGMPFAVLAVVPMSRGVAQGAFLARSHTSFRMPLARAAVEICQRLPVWAKSAGIHRLEARCWAAHPTAPRFLAACGFTFEAITSGYGPNGSADFLQFAWVQPGGQNVQCT